MFNCKNIIVLFVFFFLAVQISVSAKKNEEKIYNSLKTYAKILNHIEEKYYIDVNIDDVIYKSIKEAVKSLDPHSEFLSPKEYQELSKELDGNFVGIGVEIEQKEDDFVVTKIFKNSPAEKSGMKINGTIEKINNKSVYGIEFNALKEMLNGEENSEVSIHYFYEGNLKEYKLKRAKIEVDSVELYKINNNIIYLKINSYQKDVAKTLNNKLIDYKGFKFIIDLRDNPGGYVSEAVDMANLFIKNGVIVSSKEKGRSEVITKATGSVKFEKNDIVLIINSETASAAEIFAAAIKENKRGLIVGIKSYGKGSIQSIIELEDGSALKLTISLYYTPKHNLIQGEGVIPHIILPKYFDVDKDVKRESDLEGAIKTSKQQNLNTVPDFLKNDRQFETALNLLEE